MACAQQRVPCVRASSCVKNKEPAGVLLPLEFTHRKKALEQTTLAAPPLGALVRGTGKGIAAQDSLLAGSPRRELQEGKLCACSN